MIKRNTIQRTLVLEAVKKLDCHATAEEVYTEVIKTSPTVSKATVYRNLQCLCEMGKIKKCEIPDFPDRYDHVLNEHYHVLCTVCGKVSDIDMDSLGNLLNKIKDDHGFKFTSYDLLFKGICPDCRNKTTEKEFL